MHIFVATDADFDAFIRLAAQVEEWFGPMVNDPGFHASVVRNIRRGSALIAIDDQNAVSGALLFSYHHAPSYHINWLVVTEACRSGGVGQALLADAVHRWVRPPCEIDVVTFGGDHPGSRSRRFYERLGFEAAEDAERGPEGGSRQHFRLTLATTLPEWAPHT